MKFKNNEGQGYHFKYLHLNHIYLRDACLLIFQLDTFVTIFQKLFPTQIESLKLIHPLEPRYQLFDTIELVPLLTFVLNSFFSLSPHHRKRTSTSRASKSFSTYFWTVIHRKSSQSIFSCLSYVPISRRQQVT